MMKQLQKQDNQSKSAVLEKVESLGIIFSLLFNIKRKRRKWAKSRI